MSDITEGKVVTISVAVKTKSGSVEEATGTVIWVHQGRLAVLLPCGIIWYGTFGQVYPAQLNV